MVELDRFSMLHTKNCFERNGPTCRVKILLVEKEFVMFLINGQDKTKR